MKRREALTLAAVWTDLEHMTLAQREAPDTQDSGRVTPPMRNIQNRPPPPRGDRKWAPGCQGLGGGGVAADRRGGLISGRRAEGLPPE